MRLDEGVGDRPLPDQVEVQQDRVQHALDLLREVGSVGRDRQRLAPRSRPADDEPTPGHAVALETVTLEHQGARAGEIHRGRGLLRGEPREELHELSSPVRGLGDRPRRLLAEAEEIPARAVDEVDHARLIHDQQGVVDRRAHQQEAAKHLVRSGDHQLRERASTMP